MFVLSSTNVVYLHLSVLFHLGVITYVLLSGLSPFAGDNDSETLTNVTSGEWDFDDPVFEDISDEAKDFITELLIMRPRYIYFLLLSICFVKTILVIHRAFPRIALIGYKTMAFIFSFFRNIISKSNQIDSLKNVQDDFGSKKTRPL